jgi:hypothetical protein
MSARYGQQVNDLGRSDALSCAHRLCCFETETTGEYRKASEDLPLALRQQLITPLDGGRHRLMPRWRSLMMAQPGLGRVADVFGYPAEIEVLDVQAAYLAGPISRLRREDHCRYRQQQPREPEATGQANQG